MIVKKTHCTTLQNKSYNIILYRIYDMDSSEVGNPSGNITITFQTIFNFESIRTHLLKFDSDIRKRNWEREKIAENALQTS